RPSRAPSGHSRRTARSSDPSRTRDAGRAGACGISFSSVATSAVSLFLLRRVLGLLLRRRIGCVGDGGRRRLDDRLHRRLALGRSGRLVRAGLLDVLLSGTTPPRGPATTALAAAATTSTAAAGAAALAGRAHGTETLAVALAVAAALAGGAEALDVCASPAGLILLAEA